MATVYFPPQWRDLTGGASEVEVEGDTLGRVVAQLDQRFPGLAERLTAAGTIAAGLAVSIDGAITARGLLSGVRPHSEIHILPAIGGG